MQELSRVTLVKGQRQATLQGMIHIGPDELYEKLQKDVNDAATQHYRIFFEGVKDVSPQPAATTNEEKIREFFNTIFELYPIFAEALGVSAQKEKIAYPGGSINADVSFSSLTRLLDENGFQCNFLLFILTLFPKEEMKERLKQDRSNQDFKAFLDKADSFSWSSLLVKFLMRKAMPVILDYRNQVCLDIVRQFDRNVFVHYGQKHVQGLVKLFKKDGWRVVKTESLDLHQFA